MCSRQRKESYFKKLLRKYEERHAMLQERHNNALKELEYVSQTFQEYSEGGALPLDNVQAPITERRCSKQEKMRQELLCYCPPPPPPAPIPKRRCSKQETMMRQELCYCAPPPPPPPITERRCSRQETMMRQQLLCYCAPPPPPPPITERRCSRQETMMRQELCYCAPPPPPAPMIRFCVPPYVNTCTSQTRSSFVFVPCQQSSRRHSRKHSKEENGAQKKDRPNSEPTPVTQPQDVPAEQVEQVPKIVEETGQPLSAASSVATLTAKDLQELEETALPPDDDARLEAVCEAVEDKVSLIKTITSQNEHPSYCTCDVCVCPEPEEEKVHPPDCTCDVCECPEPEQEKVHPPDCTCDVCECPEPEEEKVHPPDCTCDVCECPEPEEEKVHPPDCTCDVCECPEPEEEKVHPPDCTCDVCECPDPVEEDTAPPQHPEFCVCPLCECPENEEENATLPAEVGTAPTGHPEFCVCPQCECPDPTDSVEIGSVRTTTDDECDYSDTCICESCKSVEECQERLRKTLPTHYEDPDEKKAQEAVDPMMNLTIEKPQVFCYCELCECESKENQSSLEKAVQDAPVGKECDCGDVCTCRAEREADVSEPLDNTLETIPEDVETDAKMVRRPLATGFCTCGCRRSDAVDYQEQGNGDVIDELEIVPGTKFDDHDREVCCQCGSLVPNLKQGDTRSTSSLCVETVEIDQIEEVAPVEEVPRIQSVSSQTEPVKIDDVKDKLVVSETKIESEAVKKERGFCTCGCRRSDADEEKAEEAVDPMMKLTIEKPQVFCYCELCECESKENQSSLEEAVQDAPVGKECDCGDVCTCRAEREADVSEPLDNTLETIPEDVETDAKMVRRPLETGFCTCGCRRSDAVDYQEQKRKECDCGDVCTCRAEREADVSEPLDNTLETIPEDVETDAKMVRRPLATGFCTCGCRRSDAVDYQEQGNGDVIDELEIVPGTKFDDHDREVCCQCGSLVPNLKQGDTRSTSSLCVETVEIDQTEEVAPVEEVPRIQSVSSQTEPVKIDDVKDKLVVSETKIESEAVKKERGFCTCGCRHSDAGDIETVEIDQTEQVAPIEEVPRVQSVSSQTEPVEEVAKEPEVPEEIPVLESRRESVGSQTEPIKTEEVPTEPEDIPVVVQSQTQSIGSQTESPEIVPAPPCKCRKAMLAKKIEPPPCKCAKARLAAEARAAQTPFFFSPKTPEPIELVPSKPESVVLVPSITAAASSKTESVAIPSSTPQSAAALPSVTASTELPPSKPESVATVPSTPQSAEALPSVTASTELPPSKPESVATVPSTPQSAEALPSVTASTELPPIESIASVCEASESVLTCPCISASTDGAASKTDSVRASITSKPESVVDAPGKSESASTTPLATGFCTCGCRRSDAVDYQEQKRKECDCGDVCTCRAEREADVSEPLDNTLETIPEDVETDAKMVRRPLATGFCTCGCRRSDAVDYQEQGNGDVIDELEIVPGTKFDDHDREVCCQCGSLVPNLKQGDTRSTSSLCVETVELTPDGSQPREEMPPPAPPTGETPQAVGQPPTPPQPEQTQVAQEQQPQQQTGPIPFLAFQTGQIIFTSQGVQPPVTMQTRIESPMPTIQAVQTPFPNFPFAQQMPCLFYQSPIPPYCCAPIAQIPISPDQTIQTQFPSNQQGQTLFSSVVMGNAPNCNCNPTSGLSPYLAQTGQATFASMVMGQAPVSPIPFGVTFVNNITIGSNPTPTEAAASNLPPGPPPPPSPPSSPPAKPSADDTPSAGPDTPDEGLPPPEPETPPEEEEEEEEESDESDIPPEEDDIPPEESTEEDDTTPEGDDTALEEMLSVESVATIISDESLVEIKVAGYMESQFGTDISPIVVSAHAENLTEGSPTTTLPDGSCAVELEQTPSQTEPIGPICDSCAKQPTGSITTIQSSELCICGKPCCCHTDDSSSSLENMTSESSYECTCGDVCRCISEHSDKTPPPDVEPTPKTPSVEAAPIPSEAVTPPPATESAADVPEPTESAADVPELFESATDVSAPTESAADVPAPTESAADVPEPTEAEADVPAPTEAEADVPEPTEAEADVPEPIEAEADVPAPTESAADVPEPTEAEADVPAPTEVEADVPEPTEAEADVPAPTESAAALPSPTESAADVAESTESAAAVPTPTETTSITEEGAPAETIPSGLTGPLTVSSLESEIAKLSSELSSIRRLSVELAKESSVFSTESTEESPVPPAEGAPAPAVEAPAPAAAAPAAAAPAPAAAAPPARVAPTQVLPETASELRAALLSMQVKQHAKDQMIQSLAEELKLRAGSNVWEELLAKVTADQHGEPFDDYDRAHLASFMSKPRLPPVAQHRYRNMRSGYTDVGSGRPSPPPETEEPFRGPIRVQILQRVLATDLLIQWDVPRNNVVVGFEVFVNGAYSQKIRSGDRNMTVLHDIDFGSEVNVTVYALTRQGRIDKIPGHATFNPQLETTMNVTDYTVYAH